MSGKKIYAYRVPPKTTVVDIDGIVRGAGCSAKLYYTEYRKHVKENKDDDKKDII